jgi:hypothetical protein
MMLSNTTINNDNINNNKPPFCTDTLIQVLSYVPMFHLVHNVALVNHYFYESVLGERTTLWQEYFSMYPFYFESIESFMKAKAFLLKYKIPNLQFYYELEDKPNSLLFKQSIVVLATIEPIVTNLTLPNELSFFNLLDIYYKTVNRHIFPKLIRLEMICASLEDYKKWFGKDLSRFKAVTFNSVESNSKDIKFSNALESISFESMSRNERNILKKVDKNSLKWIQFIIPSIQYDIGCLYGLANCIPYIILHIYDYNLVFKPIIFSNIRKLQIMAYGKHIKQFLSVTHPLLEEVILVEITGKDFGKSKIAQQPQIRKITFVGVTPIINELLTNVNTEKLKYLDITYNIVDAVANDGLSIDYSYDELEFLRLRTKPMPVIIRNPSVSQPKLLSFKSGQYFESLFSPLLSKLLNLRTLEIQTLELKMVYKIMKLPKLRSLAVVEMSMTTATMMKLLKRKSSVCNFELGSVSCSRN